MSRKSSLKIWECSPRTLKLQRNPSVKGSGGSPGKTLKRNLSLLNSIGSFTKIMIQRADWPVDIALKTALQGFGRRTFRPFSDQGIPVTDGYTSAMICLDTQSCFSYSHFASNKFLLPIYTFYTIPSGGAYEDTDSGSNTCSFSHHRSADVHGVGLCHPAQGRR